MEEKIVIIVIIMIKDYTEKSDVQNNYSSPTDQCPSTHQLEADSPDNFPRFYF